LSGFFGFIGLRHFLGLIGFIEPNGFTSISFISHLKIKKFIGIYGEK